MAIGCGRELVVDHGRISAEGTPTELKAAVGGSVLSVRLADLRDVDAATDVLAFLSSEPPRVDTADAEIRIAISDASASAEALRRLDAQRLTPAAIEIQQPSLDDVFLTLTGRTAEAQPEDEPVKEAA